MTFWQHSACCVAARNDILVIVATGGDVHGPDLQIGLGGDALKMLERFAPRFEDRPSARLG
jgi:hypothetical protein